jgi:hypothetical protein
LGCQRHVLTYQDTDTVMHTEHYTTGWNKRYFQYRLLGNDSVYFLYINIGKSASRDTVSKEVH